MITEKQAMNETSNSALEKRENPVRNRVFTPPVNVYETNEETILVVDMPGVDEKSVNITFEKDILTIEGNTSIKTPEGYQLSYSEFKQGDYVRRFTINKSIDLDKTKAVMKNGRLTLTLTKVKPNYKKIEVQSE